MGAKSAMQVQQEIQRMMFTEFGQGESLPPDAAKEFILQGLHHIRIGAQLNEAAAKYTYERVTCMYVGCAGLTAQVFIDMFCDLFGKVDLQDADPKNVETAEMGFKCVKGCRSCTFDKSLFH